MKRNLGIATAAYFVLVGFVVYLYDPSVFGTPPGLAGVFVFALLITIGTGVSVATIVANCMIARRLGYEPTAGLLLLIPVANIIVLFFWAFRESPTEAKLRRLKNRTHVNKPAPSPNDETPFDLKT